MSRSKPKKQTKKTPSVSVDAENTNLALSPLQEQIENLKQEQQWLLKQIKRKRNELSNLVEKMKEISLEIFQRSHPIVQKMMEIDQEIHQLFASIFATRKMGKKNKHKVQYIYQFLQLDGIISPKSKQNDNQFEEFYSETRQEDTEESRQEISDPPSNQRKMREIFLRLASRFHPDKVTDEETQTQYTAIMQEVNQAYQEGDFAKLLEIERNQHHEDLIPTSIDQESSEEKRILKLQRENEILKQQYEEIKEELRYLRQTPEGRSVTNFRRATKEGFDPISEMIEEAEEQLQFIISVRNFVRDFRDQKITIKEFLDGPDSLMQFTIDELLTMIKTELSEF